MKTSTSHDLRKDSRWRSKKNLFSKNNQTHYKRWLQQQLRLITSYTNTMWNGKKADGPAGLYLDEATNKTTEPIINGQHSLEVWDMKISTNRNQWSWMQRSIRLNEIESPRRSSKDVKRTACTLTVAKQVISQRTIINNDNSLRSSWELPTTIRPEKPMISLLVNQRSGRNPRHGQQVAKSYVPHSKNNC